MKRVILTLGFIGVFSFALASDAQTILKQNGCMACHNIMGMKSAPAFTGVAMRNLRWANYETAKKNIENSIKNGSKGKYMRFADAQMPPFPNLSQKDLDIISSYILSLAKNRGNMGQRGMMGRGMR